MVRAGPMPDIGWLIARPIAHRGLHDKATGRRENTLSAARAAIAAGFAIECDVQRSSDREAMVFHDFALDRLTAETGSVADRSSHSLASMHIGSTADHIPTLTELLDVIASRVPLICEIKSAFDGNMHLANRVAEVARSYGGPLAIKSFDPAVIAHLRRSWVNAPPLGIVAEANYDHPEWQDLSPALKQDLAAFGHLAETRPDFLSYAVDDLPHAASNLFRLGLGAPVITWTVRTEAQRSNASRWADQIVFEGYAP